MHISLRYQTDIVSASSQEGFVQNSKKRDTNTHFNSIDYVEESFSTTPKNILRKALIISSYTPGFELKMFYAIEWIVLVVLTWKLINFMTYRFSIKNF